MRWVLHRQNPDQVVHKVNLTAKELGVDLGQADAYEVYISNQDEEIASRWLDERDLKGKEWAFLHVHSSDLRANQGAKPLIKETRHRFGDAIVTNDEKFQTARFPIAISFALMNQARFVGLVDSAFVHAANALSKPIDVHFISERTEFVNRPLHTIRREVRRPRINTWITYRHRLEYRARRTKLLSANPVTSWRRLLRRSAGTGPDLLAWAKSEIESLPGIGPVPLFILSIWPEFKDRQPILRKPFASYFLQKNGSYEFESTEPVDPVPTRGISLMRRFLEDVGPAKESLTFGKISGSAWWFNCHLLSTRTNGLIDVNTEDCPVPNPFSRLEPFKSEAEAFDSINKFMIGSRTSK